jgi:large subunit ribosomal protein L25
MTVTKRELFGKKNKSLRKADLIPAVIYGKEVNVSVQVPSKEFHKVYAEKGHTGVSKIELDNSTYNVLIDRIQINPVSRQPIHVTLRNVNMKEEINAVVPIEYINTEIAKGVKDEGGIFVSNLSEVEVLALPANIPQHLEVDVKDLNIGDVIKLEDLKLPEGVKFATQDENLLSQVIANVTYKEEEVIPETAPELVVAEGMKEKKPEEGAEAAGTKEEKK